jgi:hypothetical protein
MTEIGFGDFQITKLMVEDFFQSKQFSKLAITIISSGCGGRSENCDVLRW